MRAFQRAPKIALLKPFNRALSRLLREHVGEDTHPLDVLTLFCCGGAFILMLGQIDLYGWTGKIGDELIKVGALCSKMPDSNNSIEVELLMSNDSFSL